MKDKKGFTLLVYTSRSRSKFQVDAHPTQPSLGIALRKSLSFARQMSCTHFNFCLPDSLRSVRPQFRSPSREDKRSAFTLAEVLITLVVIGVVAALTVPLIMARYNKHVVEVRLKKFYSTINQAIIRSEVDNGDKRYWEALTYGFEQDEEGEDITDKPLAQAWYDKYLAPYIITTKVLVDGSSKIVSYYPDGSLSLISSTSIIFFPRAAKYKGEHYQYNTVSGKDFFTFHFNPTNKNNKYQYNKGVEPYTYDWNGTREHLISHPRFGCNINATNERAYCTMLIALNNWQIPDDYPFSF